MWRRWAKALSSRKAVGTALVTCVAGIWIGASFVVSDLGERGVSWLLITYLSNATFMVNLPFTLPLPGQPSKSAMRAAAAVSPLWFTAQLAFNASLVLTTVPSNTILSTTSSLFALILSRFVLNEQLTLLKLVSVLASMTGTSLVTLADGRLGDRQPHAVAGDFLAVLSAALYACHTTLLKRMLGEGSSEVAMFFGLVGVFNSVLAFPFMLYTALEGWLNLSNLTYSDLGLIVAKGLLVNVLSDFLWAKAVCITSPTFATVGTSIDVPMSALISALRGDAPWLEAPKIATLKASGAGAVLAGFYGINYASTLPPSSHPTPDDTSETVPLTSDGPTT